MTVAMAVDLDQLALQKTCKRVTIESPEFDSLATEIFENGTESKNIPLLLDAVVRMIVSNYVNFATESKDLSIMENDIKLPLLPGDQAFQDPFVKRSLECYGKACAIAAIEHERSRILRELEKLYNEACSRYESSHNPYYEGQCDILDITEQLVESTLLVESAIGDTTTNQNNQNNQTGK